MCHSERLFLTAACSLNDNRLGSCARSVNFASRFVAPLPSLTMSLSGTNILVSWPTSGAFNLQTNADLTTANWGDYSGPVNTTNAVSSLTVSPSPATLFFRLAD